jgi:predicted transcriptional regulator
VSKRTIPELQRALQKLGAKRVEAALLAALAGGGAVGTRELVQRTGLRQPEVSVGMKVLRQRGWVEAHSVRGTGKGRPMHEYRLTAIPAALRAYYAQAGRKAMEELQAALDTLQRLT